MRTSGPQDVTVRRPSLLFVILIIIPSCPPLVESSSLPIFVPIIVSIVVFLHLRPDRRLDRSRLASRFVSAILPFINRKSPANPGSAYKVLTPHAEQRGIIRQHGARLHFRETPSATKKKACASTDPDVHNYEYTFSRQY